MKRTVIFAIVLILMLSANSYALRCGYGLVQVGNNKVQVLESCGEPILIEIVGTTWRWIEFERETRNVKVIVERWHYDVGGGVIHLLTFGGPDLLDIGFFRK